ncbi:hypothetical protein B0T25DRAFT_115958 [Lasiosphaeria hispida]|uniref:Uncharacterized protein n=1 Tax=Lasiosphaeria hispida TaxID=260671 RepID=A0AAJ0MI54_9PEZI|nr:hypothetical protein B0T25DRAFT_115958 [Lasiosphaeria hispida]
MRRTRPSLATSPMKRVRFIALDIGNLYGHSGDIRGFDLGVSVLDTTCIPPTAKPLWQATSSHHYRVGTRSRVVARPFAFGESKTIKKFGKLRFLFQQLVSDDDIALVYHDAHLEHRVLAELGVNLRGVDTIDTSRLSTYVLGFRADGSSPKLEDIVIAFGLETMPILLSGQW